MSDALIDSLRKAHCCPGGCIAPDPDGCHALKSDEFRDKQAKAAIVAVLRFYIGEFGDNGDMHVALELNEKLSAFLMAQGARGIQ